MTVIPILALIEYAITNGSAPVFQKIGADSQQRAKKLDLAILLRLMKNKPYIVGTGLQIVGLVLGLMALRVLPLFLVQSVLAGSIVFTATLERLITHHRLNRMTIKSIVLVLLGLAILVLTAESSHAVTPDNSIKLGIELAPIGLAVVGLVFAYFHFKATAGLLALVSGLAFGSLALIGRILNYPSPFWHVLINPLFWSLVIYGLIGQYLFIKALQRASGTSTNAVTLVTATLAPAVIGILLFNDKIRPDFEVELIIGSVLVVLGSLAISRYDKDVPKKVLTSL